MAKKRKLVAPAEIEPIGRILPDFQPTLDELRAFLRTLTPITATVNGILQAVQSNGLDVSGKVNNFTFSVHVAVSARGNYPPP
jgi:hypothetical protein